MFFTFTLLKKIAVLICCLGGGFVLPAWKLHRPHFLGGKWHCFRPKWGLMMTELASQHHSKDAIVSCGISVQLTVIQMAELGCSWQSETFIWRGCSLGRRLMCETTCMSPQVQNRKGKTLEEKEKKTFIVVHYMHYQNRYLQRLHVE